MPERIDANAGSSSMLETLLTRPYDFLLRRRRLRRRCSQPIVRTVEQGVQGDAVLLPGSGVSPAHFPPYYSARGAGGRSPPAGVWGVPSSLPSFSLVAAGSMSWVP